VRIRKDTVAWAGLQDPDRVNNPFKGLFYSLRHTIENGSIVTCSKHKEGAASEEKTEEGLLCGHEYGLVGLYEVPDSAGGIHRLVLTKNPHGHGEWNGKYSDGCEVWKDPVMKTYRKDVVGMPDGVVDDGVTMMSFADFRVQFTKCDVSDSCLSPGKEMHVKQVTGMITEEFCRGESEWHCNPKFLVRLEDKTTVTVSLNQPNTKIIGLDENYETAMGFRIIMVLKTDQQVTSSIKRFEEVDEGTGGDDAVVAEVSSVTVPDKVYNLQQANILFSQRDNY